MRGLAGADGFTDFLSVSLQAKAKQQSRAGLATRLLVAATYSQ